MGRRQHRFSLELVDPQLEARTLLSHAPMPAAVVEPPHHGGRNLFHHDGINGLVLHRAFVNQLNDRLIESKSMNARVIQAFRVFRTDFAQLPVNPQPGATGPTLDSLAASLKQQLGFALSRLEISTIQASVSQKKSIRRSPLAPQALIPFANAQVDKMASTLAQLPPVAGPGGTEVQGDPTPAINQAVNAVLNALAETTIHPLLFNDPGDFYLNPNFTFDINFSGAPAQAAPGYFIRGPHGAILPGATLHPHAPN